MLKIEFNGQTQTIDELRQRGIVTVSNDVIRKRLSNGWDAMKAITKPYCHNRQSKLSFSEALEVRRLHKQSGFTLQRLAAMFGVSVSTIHRIVKCQIP